MTGESFTDWVRRMGFETWEHAAHVLRIRRSTFFATQQAKEISAEREQLCRALEIVLYVAQTPNPNNQTRWIPFTPEMIDLAKDILKEP